MSTFDLSFSHLPVQVKVGEVISTLQREKVGWPCCFSISFPGFVFVFVFVSSQGSLQFRYMCILPCPEGWQFFHSSSHERDESADT